jgi:hypothetical protein
MIVFDADFVRIALLPPECQPVLLIDPNTVPAVAPLQLFESVAGGYSQIVEAGRNIEGLQFSLHDAPDRSRNATGGASVSFTKEIRRRLVGERLDHSGVATYYTGNM